jgi:hypothetical protein
VPSRFGALSAHFGEILACPAQLHYSPTCESACVRILAFSALSSEKPLQLDAEAASVRELFGKADPVFELPPARLFLPEERLQSLLAPLQSLRRRRPDPQLACFQRRNLYRLSG